MSKNNRENTIVDVIIPALNEEHSIGKVIQDIPSFVRNIIVCDNGSTDLTVVNAKRNGAIVVSEAEKGYGAACLKGMEYIGQSSRSPDIIVFLDGDYSDFPEEMDNLVFPIVQDDIDLVIGSRLTKNTEKGSLQPAQIFGNWLATTLIRWIYGYKFEDLGPFRAIKYSKLLELNMIDRNYGWTVEMQVKAARQKLTHRNIPVKYRNRIGVSKVSGTIKGSILAGYKILFTIFKYI